MGQSVKMKREIFILLLVCAFIGLIARFQGLAVRSLWVDEFFTLFQSTGHGLDIDDKLTSISSDKNVKLHKAVDFKALLKKDPSKGFKDITRGVLITDTHPPLYFLAMYVWMNVFGESVWVIRFFSLLAGIVSIYIFYLVGSQMFDRETGYFCAIFASICGFAVRYSQEARSYSLIMLISLVSLLFLIRFEKYKKHPDLFMYFIFTCLGLYTHYFYIFAVIAHFLYFSIIHRDNTNLLRKFYLALLAVFLVFSALLVRIFSGVYNFSRAEWIFGYPGSLNKLYYLIGGILRFVAVVPASGLIGMVLPIIAICLFGYMVFTISKENILKYARQLFLVLLIFSVPLLSMFIIDFIQHGALLRQERFWMFPFLGFVLFAGFTLRQRFPGNRLAVYAFILSMFFSLFNLGRFGFGPEPKEPSLWITQEAGNKPAAVIVYNLRSVVASQAYYLPDNIYFIPVSTSENMKEAFDLLRGKSERVFVCVYYHHTDPSLMNQDFMEAPELVSDFKFKEVFKKDDIKIKEYVKCAL